MTETRECSACWGGWGGGDGLCVECEGDGQVPCYCPRCAHYTECEHCGGTGECPDCDGTGEVPVSDADREAAGQLRLPT